MNTYTLINGYILDGSKEMKPYKGSVEVKEGIITRIGDFEVTTKKVIDCNNGYICPGLINLHSHLPASGKVNPNKKLANTKKLVNFILSNNFTKKIGVLICSGSSKKALLSGVTTVRTVGGIGDIDSLLKNKINSGKKFGPRLLVANTAIGVKGGHMDGTVAKAINTKEEAIAMVDELASQKVDLIKIMITGGVLDCEVVGKPGVLKMPLEIAKAICDRAHKHHLMVASHVESPEGVEVAIEAGVDTIEHGAVVNEKLMQKLKDRKGAFVATTSCATPLFLLDPKIVGYGKEGVINGKVIFDGIVECSKNAIKNGIDVGIGQDNGCPFTTHYDFYRELYVFSKSVGTDNKTTLHMATLNNAKIVGIDKVTGSIEVGKESDIIVAKSNPIDSLLNLKDLSFVSTKLYSKINPKAKHIKGYDQLLDSIIDKI